LPKRKFAQGRAPAYLYYFNWRSPVRNGKLRTMHGMELPFVFDHPDKISFMTGAGSDRAAIATTMSSTWVAFARTGNPNHSGIPSVGSVHPNTWPTMVFGSRTRPKMTPGARSERRWLPRGKEGGVNRNISDHHALVFQIGGRSIGISASRVAGIRFSEFDSCCCITKDGGIVIGDSAST
jgi:hypothetical protein